MGFKQEAAEKLVELDERVEALEVLARTLRTSGYQTPSKATLAATQGVYDGITGGRAASPALAESQRRTGHATGVDYGAIAFGLSEIRRHVGNLVGNFGENMPRSAQQEVADTYKGVVQYFSDVFAKSDATFDADEFKRLANA